jgi:hypothetical protein
MALFPWHGNLWRLSVLLTIFLKTSSLVAEEELPLLLSEDFEEGHERWELFDPEAWELKHLRDGHVLSQFERSSSYSPPHRSPLHRAMLTDVEVTDFELTARVHSTVPDYNHRDVCLYFGYQDDKHFYYVHLGKEADPHANQIFVVDDADRVKISLTTTDGTPWDDEWHTVRVQRDASTGSIEVFYDDMEKPVMTAKDDRFTWGRIGVGTFDDTADFDDIKLRGKVRE